VLSIQKHVELADRFNKAFPNGYPSVLPFDFLYGAEGEGQEPNPSGEGQEPKPEGQGSENPPTGEPQTFTREYVEALRAENADWRTKYRETEAKAKEHESKLSEYEKAQMDDLERAQKEAEENKTRAEQLEANLRDERLRNAIVRFATEKNFHDPQDAVSLIDTSEIKFDDDGRPNEQSVKSKIDKLAESKKHLLKTHNPGSGDGGAHGDGVEEDALIKQVSQELQSKGHVLIP
jgi:hypothetical protein